MFEAIIAILAGLMLLADVFQRSAAGDRFTRILLPLQSVIGLIALVVGILNFSYIIGIALIVGGFTLGAGALSGVPGIGDELKRAGQALKRVSGLIGAVLLVLAIYRLLL
jgi:hypothetical protein